MVSALISETREASGTPEGLKDKNYSTNCGERKTAVANWVEGRESVRSTIGRRRWGRGRTEKSMALRRHLDRKTAQRVLRTPKWIHCAGTGKKGEGNRK